MASDRSELAVAWPRPGAVAAAAGPEAVVVRPAAAGGQSAGVACMAGASVSLSLSMDLRLGLT